MSAVVVVRSLKSKKKSFLLLLLLVSLERERVSLLKAVRFAVVRLSTTTTKKKLRASFLRLKCEEELDIRWIYFTVVFWCLLQKRKRERERERERERACP